MLVVLSHARRRIVHANITAHPTAEWTAQQVVDAFPGDTAPRLIHRDRDRIYGADFERRVAGMGIAEVVSAGDVAGGGSTTRLNDRFLLASKV